MPKITRSGRSRQSKSAGKLVARPKDSFTERYLVERGSTVSDVVSLDEKVVHSNF